MELGAFAEAVTLVLWERNGRRGWKREEGLEDGCS